LAEVLVQMWAEMGRVLVQMWAEMGRVPVQMWQRRTALQPAHAAVRSVTRRSAAAQLVHRLPMHASGASSRTDATTAAISNLTTGAGAAARGCAGCLLVGPRRLLCARLRV
jgi:hypothetical protein